MKKQLAVVLGLSVLATPAFASKARLQALGEDTNGSFYINDNRNVFLNPSEVNNHKDLVSLEFGAAAPTATDSTVSPNAEGGLFRAHNNMVYGAQFGRNLSFNDGVGLGAGTVGADNAIDLFVGGDAGIKWGAQATYAKSENDATDSEVGVIDLAGGVTAGDIAGYLKYGVQGKEEATGGVEVERKNALEIGASYKFDNYTAFGQYAMSKFEEDATDADAENSSFQVGVGRSDKLNDKATLFTKLSYVNEKSEEDTGVSEEDKQWSVPVVIGLEYDATSWLVLRASISQAIMSKVDNESAPARDGTLAETTSVNAGASLKFGELSVDGVIGNGIGAAPVSDDTSGGQGQIRTDSLMSRASVTYRF